ncbi:MAG: aspartate/glutamate racemase family protein [Spirochaetales bacterium]|nr:aspartate/glutamate racemase family protein [Spirochaetales bacterium]
MKTIGLLGGMSWESTVSYYEFVNEGVKNKLGGLHSAKVVLYSVDFDEIEKLQHSGDWEGTALILSDAAKKIQAGGADFLLICTNTMHKVADKIEASIDIPVVHIADATAMSLAAGGIKKVGLLGTRFTMSEDFYKGRLTSGFGLEVLVPSEKDQDIVHNIIYSELCLGDIKDASRKSVLGIIESLGRAGAEAVILGCTEIALLVQQKHTKMPLYDTTTIHAAMAVELALSEV